jgi:hypothetical protein
MEQENIVKRMENILSTSENIMFEPEESVAIGDSLDLIDDKAFVESLPVLKNEEFIVIVEYDGISSIVCIEELDWISTQNIEINAHRKSVTTNTYFAGEYECREVLRRAIRWVVDILSREIKYNEDGNILSWLPQKFVDVIWNKYYPKVNLTAKEANALYKSAIDYFTGEVEEKPVPPLVIEVDMILKMGSLTRKEIQSIKNSEMQRIKLILKARAEALQLQVKTRTDEDKGASDEMMKAIMELPDNLRPPSLKHQDGFAIPK